MKLYNYYRQKFINSIIDEIKAAFGSDGIISVNDIIDYIENEDIMIIDDEECLKFLNENDVTLRRSINICREYGYKFQDISSSLLANILLQRMLDDDKDYILQTIKERLLELEYIIIKN